MAVLALLVLLIPQIVFAQGTLGPVDGHGLSPYDLNRVKAGDMAPDFRLQDQDGKVHQLSQYRGKKIVLIMYRGHW